MLYYQLILITALARLSFAANNISCNRDDEYRCKNDTCIGLELLCDGKKDCEDGSDETLEVCFNQVCDQYTFRCAYGACINGNLKCNGERDCVDNSDESKLLCNTSDEFDAYIQQLQGTCSQEFTMQCNSSNGLQKCIGIEYICDGFEDCDDGTDESPDLCLAIQCPAYAFRCAYGGCINRFLVCNHEIDCVDRSDENSDMCIMQEQEEKGSWPKKQCSNADNCRVYPDGSIHIDKGGIEEPSITTKPQSEPVWEVYPKGERGSQPKILRNCTIPTNIESLLVENYLTHQRYAHGESVPTKTMARFQCKRFFKLIGNKFSVCFDGQWIAPPPKCQPQCSVRHINRGISTRRSCSLDGQPVSCKEAASPGTKVEFTCAPLYKPKLSNCLPDTTCETNGSWSRPAPKCQPVCGIQDTQYSNEAPWVVSIYNRGNDSKFEFKCFGYVVSSKIVVTLGLCFQSDKRGRSDVDPLHFNVVEGKHSNGYEQFKWHGFRLHNVSQILNFVETDEISRSNYELALIIVTDYFEFSLSLSPICVELTQRTDKEGLIIQKTSTEMAIGDIYDLTNEHTSHPNYLRYIVVDYYEDNTNQRHQVDVLNIKYFNIYIRQEMARYDFIY